MIRDLYLYDTSPQEKRIATCEAFNGNNHCATKTPLKDQPVIRRLAGTPVETVADLQWSGGPST
jgi:hypothetical protein